MAKGPIKEAAHCFMSRVVMRKSLNMVATLKRQRKESEGEKEKKSIVGPIYIKENSADRISCSAVIEIP